MFDEENMSGDYIMKFTTITHASQYTVSIILF